MHALSEHLSLSSRAPQIKACKRDLDAAGMHTKQEHEAAALFHQAVLDAQSK